VGTAGPGVFSEPGDGAIPPDRCAVDIGVSCELGEGAKAGDAAIWLLEGAAPRPAGEDCNADGDGLCRRNALDATLRGPANPAF